MPEMLHVGNLSNPTVYTKTMERFRGVDFSSGETACAEYRSPDAMNMMPDRNGYPVKRPGYKLVKEFGEGNINGYFFYRYGNAVAEYVHIGTNLCRKFFDGETGVEIRDMEDAPSSAWQVGDTMLVADGKKLRFVAREYMRFRNAEEHATVPIITISKAPNGENGATSYRPVNLLTGKRTDSYLGTAEDKDYYTSFQGFVDGSEVKVAVLDASGVWRESTAGRLAINGKALTWTVDATLGKISFSEPVGAPPVTGEDNVRITYEVESRADVINKMRIGITYGVGGAMDRLFLSGNPDEPTVDRWSEWNDPLYFPDTNYAEIGQNGMPIAGYSVFGDKLVTLLKSETEGRNAFVREGVLDKDGNVVFRIVKTITCNGSISEKSIQTFGGEPVFLTREGIVSLTPNDLTGDRYAQQRSYFLNGALLREVMLHTAISCVWGRFYCLAINGKIYLLDNEQKSYEARSPNSSFQYEGYVLEGMRFLLIRSMWTNEKGRLCFGTTEGRCYEFESVEESSGTDYLSSDGSVRDSIKAWWSTPLLNLDSWSNLKSVKNVWVAAMPYGKTSGEIWYSSDKKAEELAQSYETELVSEYEAGIFSFSEVDFSDHSFNSIGRGMIFPTRKKAKKVKLFQVIVKNMKQQPFGLLAIALQYTKGGRIKK